MSRLIVYIRAFMLFVAIQHVGHVCLADTNKLRRHDLQLLGQNWLRQAVSSRFLTIKNAGGKKPTSEDKDMKLAAEVVDNRFIAHGIITDIKRVQKGIQKFGLQIKKIEPFKDYPDFGPKYVGREVEIFSEIGFPPTFQVGGEVFVVLRVSGDEWEQTLFLVEVIENGPKD